MFSGPGSGAGVYPPPEGPETEPKDAAKKKVPEEDESKVGTTVLDSPLSFEVTVDGWQNGNTGDDDGNTNME